MSITQKVLGSVMVANAAQTERIRRQREQGFFSKESKVDRVRVNDNKTQSEDVTKYVAKLHREVEDKRVKSKWNKKRARKSPAKQEKVSKGNSQVRRV